MKQTRLGRKLHTSARFVQMVHVIVAPNDIYGGIAIIIICKYEIARPGIIKLKYVKCKLIKLSMTVILLLSIECILIKFT